MATRSTGSVRVERTEWITARGFDDALGRVHAGLGRPDFPGFVKRLASIRDWDEYRSVVAATAGSAGLIVFLELDLGDVIARDPDSTPYRSVRIIAGNPVTMESMTRSTPAAGAYAPITLLVFEAADGTHLRYDSVVSEVGGELTDEAHAAATRLDAEVETLLRAAAEGDGD